MSLYVAFWSFDVTCLSEGQFRKDQISAEAAKAALEEARNQDALRFLVDVDLFAPYMAHDLFNYREMCRVLQEQCGISMSEEDFGINALMAYRRLQLADGETVLVISSNFAPSARKDKADTGDFGLRVAPDSLSFSMITPVAL